MFVDVVGVDFYDNWPALSTDALWNGHYMDQASGGGPHGIGAWLAFARSHGKYFDLGNSAGDTMFLMYPATTSPNASAAYQSLF